MRGRPACFRTFIFREELWRISAIPESTDLSSQNPPYGERIEDRANLPELYGALGEAYRKLDTWSMYVITAYDQAESGIGLRSSKNRKIYNGMMKTYLYEYIGPKPPRKPREGRT